MNKKEIWIAKDELLFYVAWTLFLLTTMFELTSFAQDGMFGKLLQLIRYGAYALCIVSICYKFFHKNRLFGIAGMALVLVLSLLGSTNKTMFLYIFLIVAASGMIAQNVVKVSFITMGLFWLMIIVGSQIGLIEDYIFDPEQRARHSLGFSWTTTGAILFFFLVLQYVYLRKKKITYIEVAIFESINFILYKLTDSRMAFTLLTLFLVTVVFIKLGKSQWFWVDKFKWLFLCAPSFLAIFSVAIHAFYNPENSFWIKLNSLLSGRLQLGKDAIEEYGYTLFGQNIEWKGFSLENLTGEGYNYVDCSYLQLLLQYGILFLILVIVLYTLLIYNCVKQKNYYLLWSILFILILSVTEPRLMNLAFNPFPVIFLCKIEQEEKSEKGLLYRY